MSQETILVVGGAGYVGSVLARQLLHRGHHVRVFDRLFFGARGVEDIKDRVELIAGDIRKIDPAILNGVSAVVNLGGLSNDPTAEFNPRANFEMNTVAAKNLASLCKRKGIRRYVYASSCSVYNAATTDQEQDGLSTEESEINPTGAYPKSKYDAENTILSLSDNDFCPVILRKGTVYGFSSRMRYDLVVNTFVKDVLRRGYMTLLGGGEAWRPVVEVRDVARAYTACLQADEKDVRGQVYNVAYDNFRISEVAWRVHDAFRELGLAADIKANPTHRDLRSYRVSSTKILQRLGFKATISVEDSVKEMIKKIQDFHCMDFDNPIYYNIRWMTLLEMARGIISTTD